MKKSESPINSCGREIIPTRKFSKARTLALGFGICAKTLFRWAEAGNIHRFKLSGRVVVFDEAEVEAFVERCRVA